VSRSRQKPGFPRIRGSRTASENVNLLTNTLGSPDVHCMVDVAPRWRLLHPSTVTDRCVILRRMTTGVSRVDRFERRTEWPLAVLALAFLFAYAWPILHHGMSPSWRHVCEVIDYVIWVVFVVEFITRLVLSDRRGDYAVRHIPTC
jgi:hypothetical protein